MVEELLNFFSSMSGHMLKIENFLNEKGELFTYTLVENLEDFG